MAKRSSDIMRWARLGAQVRLKELHAEIAAIHRAFPDLKQHISTSEGVPPGGGRRKPRFSAAGKKAISQGMREYWARRKALAAKTGKGSK